MAQALGLRRAIALSCCLAAFAVPAVAFAQAAASDKAAAEALFDQGLAHMREGKLEQACDELERSHAIERGIGTMLYLAECYEKLGRTASAWALFREAASAAAAQGQADRARAGEQRANRLEPQLSRLTITVAAENRVEGFELTRNGNAVREPLWGENVPVDPGEHVLFASAPGRKAWSQVVTVAGGGDKQAVAVPALEVDEAALTAAAESQPVEPSSGSAVVSSDAPPGKDPGALQRTLALVAGGAGIGALGVGTYFGLRAISKNDDAERFCPGGGERCTDPRGVEDTNDAKDAATLSNIFVIGGAALAAAGVVLYLTAPTEAERASVAVLPSGDGALVELRGAF